MTERPALPPLLRPFAATPDRDPFERCLELAAEGAEAGTLVWSIGQENCECAVVLAPEQALEPSLPIVLIAMLGLADALGAMVPPMVAVDLRLAGPDRGQRRRGRRRALRRRADREVRCDPGLAGDRRRRRHARLPGPARRRDQWRRTTLADEGCGDVPTIDLLEAFGRHFLAWINRWQEEGVKPVHQAWLSRATGLGKLVEIRIDDQVRAGTFEGLTETGAIRLVKDGVAQTIALDEAIRVPTWSIR